MIERGRYRDRVTYQRASEVSSTRGVRARAWATVYARIPASVETATASRLERLFPIGGSGGRIESVQSHIVSLPGRVPLTLKDRFIWHDDPRNGIAREGHDAGDRLLEITAIYQLGNQREQTVCGCEERER